MLPFEVDLRAGQSPARQVVYAATKAMLAGDLRPGDTFPSVRELSQALRINPNTAQKVVAELTRAGLLEVHPGVGTVVAVAPRSTAAARRHWLGDGVERLVVEARRLGLDKPDVLRAVDATWDALFDTGRAPRRSA